MTKRPLRPLTEISSVDWTIVDRHWVPYGDAREVPDLLRQLLSPNGEMRLRAWARLTPIIHHQSSVYHYTAEAIPFLFDIATRSDSHKLEVLDFLCFLAEYPGPREYAPNKRVRDLLLAGLEAYISALHSDDSRIREVAAAILGFLPEAWSDSAIPLAAAIATESNVCVLPTEIWAFGIMVDADRPTQLFESLFHRHTDLSVRAVVASFLLKWAVGSVDEVFVRTVAEGYFAQIMGNFRIPCGLLEDSLHSCALGGKLLQQINTGRYVCSSSR